MRQRGARSLVRGRRRRRLALVTPWPPEQSGVADYSLRLATALAEHVDVEVVVSGPVADFAVAPDRRVKVVSSLSRDMLKRLRRSDRVLYCMGNSSFHLHVYDLLRQHPGAVLLHDAQLTGFYGWYAGRERPEDPLGRLVERVEQDYGALVPPDELRTAPLSWERRAALGIYLTAEIQRYAQQVFVHSQFAQQVVERDGRVAGHGAPVSVMPFGMPPPSPDGARSSAGQPPLVVHMGVVGEIKGIAVLIEAFAQVAARHPGAKLLLAGPVDDAAIAHWRSFAAREAPSATIELLGRVSVERWQDLLAAADVAVQLRVVSNGEASAAVCDCIAAGVPTVVTDLGWMSELPESAVARVAPGVAPAVLAGQIGELIADLPRRALLSAGALACAADLSFERVATDYIAALGLA